MLFDGIHCLDTFLVLFVKNFFLPPLVFNLILQLLIYFVFLALICGSFEVHLLNFKSFLGYFFFEVFHFLC